MKLDMIGIIVSDLNMSLEFYKVFGLDLKEKYSDHYVELEHDGLRISLNTQDMIEGVYGYKPQLTGDRLELAFKFKNLNELEETLLKLKGINTKVVKDTWKTDWEQYYAIVEDPDGNILSLFTDTKD